MPSLRIFGVLLLTLGLIGFIGDSSFVTAGGSPADPPHETHLTHVRGPAIGLDCAQCHTGTPDQNNVDDNSCDPCHRPGGAYDGVNDPIVGALNNWENISNPAVASQSMIYENGTLKSGKEKWCATCHDAPDVGEVVFAVDDFEGYASDSALSIVWIGRQDTNSVSLVTPSVPQGSKAMEVDVWWEKSTKTYGSASRDYSPALNLDAADSVGFWLRVESTSMFSDIKIKLRIEGTADWSIGTVDFNAFNMQAGEWKWIHISRADFTNNTDGWTTVDRIQFRANENSGTSYHVSFWIDDVNFFKSDSVSDAPNVVRDDQTWGYYVTGHRFVCTTCHDPSSAHIDGNRKSIFTYIQDQENPTNFRFYNDPTKQMELPYNDELVPGETGSFALCYQCHEESNFMTSGEAETLVTNFTDLGAMFLVGKDNLHLIHLNLSPMVYNATCVACHDPHGQSKPAMTRYQMGGFFYFDFDGCEITDQADWHNPGINRGAAQRSSSYAPVCGDIVCHLAVVPPKEPPCDIGDSPYRFYSTGNNGYYVRDYEYVPHAGNMDVGPICLTAGCHPVNKLHAAHFAPAPPAPGPGFSLNEEGCYNCHADGRTQCVGYVRFADGMSFADTSVCADALCHPNP